MSWMSLTQASGSSPQPIRTTVHHQLIGRAQLRRDVTLGRARGQNTRRTVSMDTMVGSYMQGRWPRTRDTSTQTPDSLFIQSDVRRGPGCHKRSASWESTDHLCQSQAVSVFLPLPSPWRCSIEGLNQELEIICQPAQQQLLEVPDGHRAPVPPLSRSSRSQSDLLSTDFSSYTSSSSPPPQISSNSTSSTQELGVSGTEKVPQLSPSSHTCSLSSSLWPNKTFCFQRVPPEGCEKVTASTDLEDRLPHTPPLSCPDANKVNFSPYGDSAFCPVGLPKPQLPSTTGLTGSASPASLVQNPELNLLFQNLVVSHPTQWDPSI